MSNNKVLLIIGMHRSGTSLTAQWMSKCGLHLGDRLLGSSPGNKFGHVEDMDFLEFHEELLQANGQDFDVTEVPDFNIHQSFVHRANTMIQQKSGKYVQWGWKEPRTTLFMPFWDQLIDNPYYLIVHRPYREVVDSLLRREYKTINRRRNIFARVYFAWYHENNLDQRANHYLKVWIAYNRAIIQFVKTHTSSNQILLSNGDLERHSAIVLDRMIDDWGFDLQRITMDVVFKKGHMKKNVKDKYLFQDELVSEAEAITNELQQYSALRDHIES